MRSLLRWLTVATATSGLIACSEHFPVSLEQQPTSTPTHVDPAPVTTAPRTLVSGKAPTGATNLLLDPSFALTDSPGSGGFLPVYEAQGSLAAIDTEFDSRSPAGIGNAIGKIAPTGGTDTKSKAVLLLASFAGGPGPFTAQVWVSKTTVSGDPISNISLGNTGISASITTDPNAQSDVVDLTKADQRVSGGRTWILLRGQVTTDLSRGGFFFVRTGTDGGHYLVASPSLVADPLAAGTENRALVTTSVRPLRAEERRAIQRYKAIPPRLVPPAIEGPAEHAKLPF